jgi:hypothetical protein
VPNGVCVVWAGFLQEPLEAVRGRPRLTLVATRDGRGVPHTRAARLPIVAIVVASLGRDPLKALLAPLFVALDALLAVVGGDIRRCSLADAQDCLLASLGWMRHDRLVASGMLGGDVARCLECVPEEVAMLTLVRAPCAMRKLRARAALASLAVGLWLDAPALPPQ